MPFDLQPSLSNELVSLRPLAADDFLALYAVASDPRIWEQHPASDRHEVTVFQEFFREALASGGALLAIDARDGRVIGSSRFHGFDAAKREVEIGWTFLARSHWGGRTNRAMKALMLGHAFRFVDAVCFRVGPQNHRSRRAVEKIGGELAGESADASGRVVVVYRLTAAAHSAATHNAATHNAAPPRLAGSAGFAPARVSSDVSPVTTERRYDEDEVAAIFERATLVRQSERPELSGGEGMTLAELQSIGRDVGIEPDVVAEAALALDRPESPAARRFLGFPIGVGRTVDLPRKLSDDEWERLVVDLRETFDARGKVQSDGSFRQWTNGGLQVLLEPTATGQRVRLHTVKSDARGLMIGGLAITGMAMTMLIAKLAVGGLGDLGAVGAVGVLFAMGLGMFGAIAFRLRGWAKLRQQQMDALAARIVVTASTPPDER